MIPRLASSPPRTRPVRANMGQPRLESLAAEFALLTQRRSRAIHELELLDQQRANTAAVLLKLQKRISWIMDRMDALGPDLRISGPEPSFPLAHPASAIPSHTRPPTAAEALAEIGRQWIAAQPPQTDQPSRPRRPKRP